jgi:hypothetical protein
MKSNITFNDNENTIQNGDNNSTPNITKTNKDIIRTVYEKGSYFGNRKNNPDSLNEEIKYKVNYRNSNTNTITNNSISSKNYIRKGEAEKKRSFLLNKVKNSSKK